MLPGAGLDVSTCDVYCPWLVIYDARKRINVAVAKALVISAVAGSHGERLLIGHIAEHDALVVGSRKLSEFFKPKTSRRVRPGALHISQ
jgi:hypothetical protein